MYNPLVTGAPHIRFYAGAPLVTSAGMRLGSLCVIDKEPRHLDAEQLMVLANFAEVVVREIEKDLARVRAGAPFVAFRRLAWLPWLDTTTDAVRMRGACGRTSSCLTHSCHRCDHCAMDRPEHLAASQAAAWACSRQAPLYAPHGSLASKPGASERRRYLLGGIHRGRLPVLRALFAEQSLGSCRR